MAAGLLQWNPSTLRTQWDSSNLRAMMAVSTCAYCFQTPVTVTVTFADVIDTACELGIGTYQVGTDVATNINGAHVCALTSECVWSVTYTGALGDYGQIEDFVDSGCTQPGATDEYDSLVVQFQVAGDGSFTIDAYTTGDDTGYCFRYRGVGGIVGADCDLTGPYSNVITGGNYGGLNSPTNSGTASLVMAY